MDSARLAAAVRASLTYGEVGATVTGLPAGYRHLHRERELGTGRPCFEAAAQRLLSWDVHRLAGLTVEATAPRAAPGAVLVLGLGVGRLRLHAPCRVVLVLEEPRRRGFAYGTLAGHPERGEELFVVSLDDADRVRLAVTAFSRPATWAARVGGPVSRRVQDAVVERYLRAAAGR